FAIDADATVGSARNFVIPCACFCSRTVVGRYVFYNHSFFDGNDGAGVPNGTTTQCQTFNGGVVCDDNSAVSTRIVALLPTQLPLIPVNPSGSPLATASQVNYSSYIRGINGIMIDVQYFLTCSHLPAGTLTPTQVANTFEFIETGAGNTGRRIDSAFTGI